MLRPDNASLSDWISSSQQLSKAIDQPEHLANPFCNILNCTRKTAAGFPDLLGKKTIFWRLLNSLAGAGITLFRSCVYWPRSISLVLPKKHVDVVFVSHLISVEDLNKQADFYFGDLSQAIEKNEISTHTVFINHARIGHNQSNDERRTVLPAYLSPIHEAGIIFKLFLASFTLPRVSGLKSARFYLLAKLSQFSSRAIADYRIGIMLSQFVHSLSPKVVIHTYEGHGWERILAYVAHKKNPSLRVFGCQHAVIFPGPKAILQHRGDAMPDHIFTTGEAATTILVKEGELPESCFSVLGSSKAVNTSVSTRFDARGACLIAPEGILDEVMLMARIGIDAARTNPEQQFVLRLHPILSQNKVVNAMKEYHPIPDNFSLSEFSLVEDLQRSSWLCYRGSTVAFQGMLAGLRPIFIDPDETSSTNDPLPQGLAFRRICSTGDEINALIKSDRGVAEPNQTEFKEAVDFAMSYLEPLAPDTMIKKIKAL